MKADLLRLVGVALYGSRFQSDMARELGVTFRTVNRWLFLNAMPDDMPARLRPIVRKRFGEVAAARRLLWSDRRVYAVPPGGRR